MSSCDSNWDVDLICKYFKDSTGKVVQQGSWYKQMDPGGTLDDRKFVFDLLKQPTHSNPSLSVRGQSMIPWNQLNDGIVKAFNTHLACGSVVKITFSKYMGWKGEPRSRSLKHPKWDGISWIKKSLTAGVPVRAFLKTKHHYVGIVGFSERTFRVPSLKLLVMDPWPGGAETGATTLKYAGHDTLFLGEAFVYGDLIFYDSHKVTAVEGFHPF